MSSKPQFIVHNHASGPNPIKVTLLLRALGLNYESVWHDFAKQTQKGEDHVSKNPNGRTPTLIDNNTGTAVWESNAIMLYLQEKYDKENKFGPKSDAERFELYQWLFFQGSGQGPYFGQRAWFKLFHSEKLPSAIERYGKEIERVIGVLETALSKKEWLVGDRMTIADLSFIPWNVFAFNVLVKDELDLSKYPHVKAWHEKMMALPYVKEAYADAEANKH